MSLKTINCCKEYAREIRDSDGITVESMISNEEKWFENIEDTDEIREDGKDDGQELEEYIKELQNDALNYIYELFEKQTGLSSDNVIDIYRCDDDTKSYGNVTFSSVDVNITANLTEEQILNLKKVGFEEVD